MTKKPDWKSRTTLWSIVDDLQTQLEREGMDTDAVDAAVMRGLEAIFVRRYRGRRSTRFRSLLLTPGVAKA